MKRTPSASRRHVLRQAVEGLEPRRLFATFTVTTVADSGAGSLRDAITQANADQTLDTIAFAIPGGGVHTIQPLTALPTVLSPVDINGYTQPGSSPNTLAVGDNAVLQVELNADLLGNTTTDGLVFSDAATPTGYVTAGGSTVRGLAINGNFDAAVHVKPEVLFVSITVAGNFLGTNAAGTATVGAGNTGIFLESNVAIGNHIGGPSPAERNVIAGQQTGIKVLDGSGTVIENNYIGLDHDGARSIAAAGSIGISISNAVENLIGGDTPAERNVITGLIGISISGQFATANRVIGNYVGTAADGVAQPVDSGLSTGVSVGGEATRDVIGGTTPAEGNVIAYASQDGVVIGSISKNIPLRFNSLFGNKRSIRLAANNGASGDINDLNDLDTGGNDVQNFAALTSATVDGAGTHVDAVFNSLPDRVYVVDFYANPAGSNPFFGEAKTYLGSASVKTDGDGNAVILANLPAVPAGTLITDTVTDQTTAPYGNTSQVSQAVQVIGQVTPPPPPVLPSLTVANVSTSEGNSGTKTLTFTVKLSEAATTAVSVLYHTQDGSAKTGDNDYVAKTGSLTFAAGETTKTVSITVKGDTKVEGNESFNLLLSGASGATIADGSAVGTITNDDAAPALPKLSIGGYTATEGHSGTKAFTFKVTLDKSSASTVKVNYATSSDSATSSDYTGTSGVLTFSPGQTVKTVTVYVKGDKIKESDEKFFVLLSGPTNATISVAKATGLIKNDD